MAVLVQGDGDGMSALFIAGVLVLLLVVAPVVVGLVWRAADRRKARRER